MKQSKKIVSLFLVGAMAWSLAACTKGGSNSNSDKNAQTADKDSENVQKGNADSTDEIYNFTFEIEGETYQLPGELTDYSDNGWRFGYKFDPDEKDVTGKSFGTCNVSKDSKSILLTVINTSGDLRKYSQCKVGNMDCEFSDSNDIEILLPKNLKIHKDLTIQDLIDKWGEPTLDLRGDEGSTLRYEKEEDVFYQFLFDENKKLTHASLSNQDADMNSDHVVDNTKKDDADTDEISYQAPSALEDNFQNYVFRLENKLYSLPAPVSEFLDDGWEIATHPDSVAAGKKIPFGFSMRKGDIELEFTIKNLFKTETEPKNTYVIGIIVNQDIDANLDFELSGGIKCGISTSDFESMMDTSILEKTEYDEGIVEYFYFDNPDSMLLTFTNNKLNNINIEKDKFN